MLVNGHFPLQEDDVKKFMNSGCHCGEKTVNSNMKTFVFSRKTQGHYLIDLKKTWQHLLLAAQVLSGIENPKDILVVSSSNVSNRAVLKFASYTKCSVVAGNYTTGTLTNQSQKHFQEPRIIVVADPVTDHQVIMESSYMGIPVIAMCNTNCQINYIDIVIPCNNRGVCSVGVMWWMLTREVLRFQGVIDRKTPWNVMVDMFFQREQTAEETTDERATLVPLVIEKWTFAS
ncbi:40S ribosomal protein SA [Thelohanellus kitauei]|uniref:Small ribosomal subunit protein uS2 n=1 Tax=Thelohanellus kitauei TaxID=669202 RepID=A0A0C2J332_THEKT|nr:40S ribosomal protein SA [Thelohanellus kitauei]